MKILAYVRDQGPICYASPLFHRLEVLDKLGEQLLSSGLDWYWESERGEVTAEDFTDLRLPAKRSWTKLTPNSAGSLASDFLERDVDGYGRFICAIGADPDHGPGAMDGPSIATYLREFALLESGPIRVVIAHEGDVADDCIFVPHETTRPVGSLLATWGIVASAITKTYKYKGKGTLERMAGL